MLLLLSLLLLQLLLQTPVAPPVSRALFFIVFLMFFLFLHFVVQLFIFLICSFFHFSYSILPLPCAFESHPQLRASLSQPLYQPCGSHVLNCWQISGVTPCCVSSSSSPPVTKLCTRTHSRARSARLYYRRWHFVIQVTDDDCTQIWIHIQWPSLDTHLPGQTVSPA